MGRYCLSCLIVILSLSAFGQINNQSFERRMQINPQDSSKLFAGFSLLGFFKNNEWFDTTVDGYTLFGYQANPHLSYQLSDKIRVDAGWYVQKDFGNDDSVYARPNVSIKYKSKSFSLIFGTLEGRLSHRLIEPLYDFENGLTGKLEDGVQFLWQKDGLFLDAWIDWQNMIYQNDDEQEQFVAGISFSKKLLQTSFLSLELPVQAVAQHRGGQINIDGSPVLTTYNTAVGLALNGSSSGFITEWGLKSYYVSYSDASSAQQVFEDGDGIFLNAYAASKFGLTIMGSYWSGHEFISPTGGRLYPSVVADYPTRIDRMHEFYMLRFLYEQKLSDGLILSARAEPFYDTYADAIEYSYALYLNFNTRFFLTSLKREKDH
ncbi:MAG: hypothetical protein L0Y35_01615 [Flammeovirgaceae bacterium]|nr:hypothetical protein [Flammeovirgaceae bacterium]